MRRWTHVWSEAEPKCSADRTGPGTGLCDRHQASVAPVGIARIIMLSVFSCYSAVKVTIIIDIMIIIKICPAGRPLHLRRTRHLCGSSKTNPSRERFHNDNYAITMVVMMMAMTMMTIMMITMTIMMMMTLMTDLAPLTNGVYAF